MAVAGWVLDKSVTTRSEQPVMAAGLAALPGSLFVCPVGRLGQLYSAESAGHYDEMQAELGLSVETVPSPPDVLERVLRLQRDLAHHHGMWHRVPIPDLLIAELALANGLGVLHLDGDFDRIAEVRPLVARRVRATR